MENTWKEIQKEELFVYTTPAVQNAESYRFEERFGKVVSFFTLVVFLLSESGLAGLSVYIAALRRREIGIRKILGANTPGNDARQILSIIDK